jgi:hypothetical protein
MKFSRLTVLFFFAISGFFWLATSVFAQKQNLVAMTNNSTEAAPRRFKAKRLACLIHAASVHPEPGSNSQFISVSRTDCSAFK